LLGLIVKITLDNPKAIGTLIRATRKVEGMRQDDVAGAVGVSDVFLGRLENGATGARLDKVFQVLTQLGLKLHADVTDAVAVKFADLERRRAKSTSKRLANRKPR
jgi:transcriptional regulator with XRE-family HTH domain